MTLHSDSQVDWVHPSVRDLAIDYLGDHDAERRAFLSTTTPAGLILALSTGGGATGQRTFPLLVTDADWDVVTTRLEELVSTDTAEDRLALARGVLSPLTADPRLARGDHQRLRELAARLQHALRAHWDERPTQIATAALAAYYEVSIHIGELTPSPKLRPTWTAAFARASAPVEDMEREEGAFTRVEHLLRLATILKDNEPRFLRIVQFPASFAESAEALVDRMKELVSEADELYEDEVVEEEDEEGNTYETPIEPDASEYDELQWFTEAVAAAEPMVAWFPDLDEEIRIVVAGCEEHQQVRKRRQERWDEWKYDQQNDEREEAPRGYESGSPFNIDEFFADL